MVLGNKQILSMFFLVVVLFGVFFSLGYMVGRGSTASPAAAASPVAVTDPPAVETRPSPVPAPAAGESSAASAETAAAPVVRYEPETKAQPPAPAADAPAAAKSPAAAAALLVRDLHLQVAALRIKEDADELVQDLRKKGYQPLIYSQARDGWHRIILGPFPSESGARDVKSRLERDGYNSIIKKP